MQIVQAIPARVRRLIDEARDWGDRNLGPWGMFLRGFARNPVMVGSIVPSSARTVAKVLGPVDWAACDLFVEYGPGVGTFCGPVLDRLRPDATLLVIDTNADFIAYLRRRYADSRFVAVHGSAADVEQMVAALGKPHADYIISGLPFSTLPGGVADEIAAATHRVLRPGGSFCVYQFRPRVRDFIAPHFARIDAAMEYWNVPPCFIYWGWKD